MATKRHVKKRGKHYLCNVTPYWDSENKRSRHRKIYLGPCAAEGNLQDKGSVPMGRHW